MKRATLTSSPPSPTGPPSASNITLHPQLGGPQSTSSLWYHLIYVVFGGPVMRAAGGGFPVAHAPSFRARRGEGGYGSVGVLASMRPVPRRDRHRVAVSTDSRTSLSADS